MFRASAGSIINERTAETEAHPADVGMTATIAAGGTPAELGQILWCC